VPSAMLRLTSSGLEMPRRRATCQADPLLELDGHDVHGFLDGLLERGGPAELAIVVLGLPRLSVLSADGVGNRRVLDLRGGREPGLERRDIDEGLEGGAGLPLGLHRPVELAPEEIRAADHRLHVAGLRLHRDHRPLGGLARLGLRRAPLEGLQPFAE